MFHTKPPSISKPIFIFFINLFIQNAHAIKQDYPEGVALGFPELTQLDAKPVAEGTFEQWIENGKLNVKIQYAFKDGRTTEERLTLAQAPELKQESWSWQEKRGDQLIRQFQIDFNKKRARALKFEQQESKEANGLEKKEWNENLDDIVPGQTFAGIGMSFAVKNLMDRLIKGEKIILKAVSFTPKPRVTDIEVSRHSEETIPVSAQKTQAHHIVMHPKIPAVAKIFVEIKDLHLWISTIKPHSILRFEGPHQEPNDPVIRLNVYPTTTQVK